MGETPASAAPKLVLETDGESRVMNPSRSYDVGRDPSSDVVLPDPRVSWHHAVLRVDEGHWTLQDVGSTNGTFVGGQRVQQTVVGPGTVIRFASANDGPSARLSGAPQPTQVMSPGGVAHSATGAFRQPTTVRPVPTQTIKIGRATDNDLVIDDLVVSRHHAELRARPDGGHEIVDVGSHNGTFLNGQPVYQAPVLPGDFVGIGHSVFRFVGDELQEFVDTGEVSLDVQDLTVQVDNGRKTLLDHVSFPVGEKSLLAIVGPSGSGKSTLLNALTGQRPADQGRVLYDGRDLYRHYPELRQRIGLVPQDDILHTRLTVRRALGYAAELRFPDDTAKAERDARVEEVIGELRLHKRADQTISSLSGGQRKRVSVALELLTKPSLLFLDEPTSGLDPGMDHSVMNMLRGLADDGRTVIVVTHSVLSLDVCDRLLVLAPGGRTAFYGSPDETLPFFGFAHWREAFAAFETDEQRDWAGQYRDSPLYRRYIAPALEQPDQIGSAPPSLVSPPKAQSWAAQVGTLMRRYFAVLVADRTFLTIVVALPIILGAMVHAVAGSRLTPDTVLNALLLLCVGAVLTGAANSVRELVKERVIYQRERGVGLSRSAYLFSKIAVLGLITVAQALIFCVVGLVGVELSPRGGGGVFLPPLIEITLAVALVAFASMMLGLLLSSLVKREEDIMPLLVLLVITQFVCSGVLLPLDGVPGLEQLAWLAPARWGLAAMAGTVDVRQILATKVTADPMFQPADSTWLLNISMVAVLSIVLGLLLPRLLRRHEPAIMRK